ncbi:diguanylate cyclase domain-containing protein [Marinitoga litoralis]|jgi:diguanylate cyclase (GGDEF)-like protein|uniref:diguanylate cyclase domain-containing protein n=1 Tax=Marinitoga litoralis TaxID=570855 RepID=UPI00195F288D|nr:diguanylate cyclase [Marinitoga litoralis]MBM7560487.1 diguanylate cyclase (GGDEF)-like protein [Marinitoga litoralis]
MENYLIECIQKSLEYIEKNIDNYFSLEDIANYANYSLSYLYKLFNLIVGMSIKEYVRKRRLSESVKDLVNSNMSILEIAIKYQYNSYESYSRAFKKEFGVCPSEVKKNDINLLLFEPIKLRGGIDMEKKNYLFLIDIDKFANINKNYGKKFGDFVLSKIPERIKKILDIENIKYEDRKNAKLERMGGDEFILVLKNIDEQMAKNISEKILREVSNPIIYEGIEAKVTVSIGITEYAIYTKDPYNIAYDALVSAKKYGRNNYKIN